MEELLRYVYSSGLHWGDRVNLRIRQIMAAPDRLRTELRGWLKPSTTGVGLFLDVGCGFGTLLAAAAAEGLKGIGIDVSMVSLVVTRRLVAEWGGQPLLAAALAEALPLADGSVSGVVSLDVLEHVADQGRYLSEINRVTAPGGYVALSTPNRYSLAAEPHVFVLGVGWLPRSLQKDYVKWRSGKSYEFTWLLSAREVANLLRQHTHFQFDILVPPVPEEEIVHFPTYRATLARLYNRLVFSGWMRWLLLRIGPFFHIIGKKT
ncbi:MAG TPA: class I SAM-dependent methyltransferase [Candidatus Hypogeohydataceae bacterium YC41]